MRYFVFPGLVMLICLSLSGAQSGQHSNKPEPLAILASATFVFVEAFDGPDSPGSVRDPRVTPEDREAVENVQHAVQKWGYYILTIRRSEADLVVFVRKGREVNAYSGGHAGNGIPPSSQASPAQKPEAAALLMAEAVPQGKRVTLGGDKNYDTREFVQELRGMNITPHVAQNTTNRRSAIDERTTRHAGYEVSQRKRKRVEQSFGWMKIVGMLKKVKLRGIDNVGWLFTFTGAAYNLCRLRNLMART
jgi:hypothetical protein